MTNGERFALGSMAAGCLVLGLKGAAWWLTGSAALYSDALETTVNVAASLVAWLALRFAARPADANHPYGHDKAEFFAAVIEGVLIVSPRVLIFAEAWRPGSIPGRSACRSQGIGLNAVATVINARLVDRCCCRPAAACARRAGGGRPPPAGRCGDLGRDRGRHDPGGLDRAAGAGSAAGGRDGAVCAVVRRWG